MWPEKSLFSPPLQITVHQCADTLKLLFSSFHHCASRGRCFVCQPSASLTVFLRLYKYSNLIFLVIFSSLSFPLPQKSRRDVGNFDKEFTKMVVELTPTDKLFIMNLDQNEFQGFSYTNPEFIIQVWRAQVGWMQQDKILLPVIFLKDSDKNHHTTCI